MKKNELEETLESLGWTVEVLRGAKYWATGMRASIRAGSGVVYLFAGERTCDGPPHARGRQEILNDAENDILHTITYKRLIEKAGGDGILRRKGLIYEQRQTCKGTEGG